MSINKLLLVTPSIFHDGGCVLLVPWRGKPNTYPKYQSIIEKMMQFFWLLLQKKLVVAPFPISIISHDNWVDRGHLNKDGCLEKATDILPYVRQVLFDDEQQ
jgi:hypothetical protein